MPKFVKTDRVAVSDDAGNTVYVRRRMDLGTKLRIQEASAKGEGLLMLYVLNILGWDGPDFRDPDTRKPIACTAETIATVDSDDPFWEKVGDKIAELNPWVKGEDTADPLASTTDGAASMTGNGQHPVVASTST